MVHDQVPFEEVIRLTHVIVSTAERYRLAFSDVVDRVEGALDDDLAKRANDWTDLRSTARALLRARSRRSELLGVDMFRDPAWEILLDLYVNGAEGGMMISALCHAAGVPPTTALRYVHKLVDVGALLVDDDPTDHRRTMVRLAPHLPERMEQVLRMMQAGQ